MQSLHTNTEDEHCFIQGDSVARGSKLLSINSLGLLATESPCIIVNTKHKSNK